MTTQSVHIPGTYAELTKQIRALGLLRSRPWSYAGHGAVVLAGLALVVVPPLVWRDSWWLLFLAVPLGLVSTQIGFLGHDVGHLQVTRNARHSRVIGLVVANLMAGLSYGWWVRKHNAHHAHPNDLEVDPDVRVGMLVFDADQAGERRGAAAWATRHQALLFFPLLLGEAVNLHVASVRELFVPGLRQRALEGLLMLAHFLGYLALLVVAFTWWQAIAFVAIHKGVQGLYLGCSFAPNHKGMPVLDAEQARDPLLRQVLTSRNIRGGFFTDAAFGGLNYQIEHHLYPSMPRANLRHAQPVVQRFCEEHGIRYVECSAVASYAAAIGHLHHVGAGLRAAGGR
ncbi:fatty acid desaturase family protein [Nocardioides jensenii]|uniref:fatty acid desaturase family protein n=1 Tax=Nocardioides jensenii TaxID=1843 RepID=UPI0008334CBE|nr:acyl-CoA desaturase [Nocardioides jensenii]